jgi:hypothetical protein
MKKKLLRCLLFILPAIAPYSYAQQIYNDFEGVKLHYFGLYNGELDSLYSNHDKTGINQSDYCGMYVRSDTVYYDVIHLKMHQPLFRLLRVGVNRQVMDGPTDWECGPIGMY